MVRSSPGRTLFVSGRNVEYAITMVEHYARMMADNMGIRPRNITSEALLAFIVATHRGTYSWAVAAEPPGDGGRGIEFEPTVPPSLWVRVKKWFTQAP